MFYRSLLSMLRFQKKWLPQIVTSIENTLICIVYFVLLFNEGVSSGILYMFLFTWWTFPSMTNILFKTSYVLDPIQSSRPVLKTKTCSTFVAIIYTMCLVTQTKLNYTFCFKARQEEMRELYSIWIVLIGLSTKITATRSSFLS